MDAEPRPRLPSLDGWRAVAISLVMLAHTPYANDAFKIPAWLQPMIKQGDLGVRIFFVIRGFLITFLLIEEGRQLGSINLRHFYARRALRIFPVYYLYLLVVAGLQAASLYHDAPTSWLGSLTYTRNMLGRGDSITVHLWSLAIEEQFYLAWPAIMVALRLWCRCRLAIAVLLAVIAISFVSRMIDCTGDTLLCKQVLGPKSLLKYADSLAVGCAGAVQVLNWGMPLPGRLKTPLLYPALAGLIGSVVIADAGFGGALGSSLLMLAQALLTMLCIMLSISEKESVISRLLNLRIVAGLGVISYSLYVWHVLFLGRLVGPASEGVLVFDARVWWGAAIATAVASYLCFERPLVRLRRRLHRPLPPAAG